MSEVPLYPFDLAGVLASGEGGVRDWPVQGYLAHKKTPTPLGPPQDPWYRPTVGS